MRVVLLVCWLVPARQMAKQSVLNWRYKIRPELAVPNVSTAVAQALREQSSCVPVGGIALSVTNVHHAHLRPEQFALMKGHGCFMRRLVTVCYSVSDHFGLCVGSSYKVPPSDFRRSHYANLIWAKWRILADALSVANMAMWLDADVLLLRNPWLALGLLEHNPSVYHFRHQSEDPCAESECAGLQANCANVNGGQLVMASRRLADQIYESRPENLTNYHRLDQDFVEAIIRDQRNGFTACALPASFASHCWNLDMRKGRDKSIKLAKRVPFVPLCDRVTHHFNCVPERRKKTQMMRSMIDTWRRTCNSTTTLVTTLRSALMETADTTARTS